MYGMTNAVITQGGSGGGDLVYAENNTGSTITSGTKALLNNHVTTATTYTELYKSTSSSNANVWYIGNQGYFMYGSGLYRADYDEASGWSYTQVANMGSDSFRVDFPDGLISVSQERILRSAGSTQYLNGYGSIPSLTQYIGDGLCVYINTTDSFAEIRGYDVELQTVGDTALMQICSSTQDKNGRIIKSGDKLFFFGSYDTSSYVARIIDLSTYTILGTTGLGTTRVYPAYITGCEVGDLVFVNQYAGNLGSANGLTVYKINADYQLELYTPDILSNYSSCIVFYNSYNKTLCLGLKNGARFFSWDSDTKTLATIPFSVTLPTDEVSGSYYIGDIAADRTQAVVFYYQEAGSSDKRRVLGYNLTDDSSGWHADATSLNNYYPDRTLTGIATGNVSDGKYEFATALPNDTATLTVEVTPSTASYSITGEVE